MRIEAARQKLAAEGKIPFLCSNLTNIRYLTGFTGSHAYMVFLENETVFITDTRYEEYAATLLNGKARLYVQNETPFKAIAEVTAEILSTLYVEDHAMYMSFYKALSDAVCCQLAPSGDIVDRMRMVKNEEEIALIRKAVETTDRCTEFVASIAKTGMTEWELSTAIENFYRSNGCRKSSFDTIVASGAGSSMPHYIPSMTKKIESGDALMIDMGALRDGYNSDLTRTFFIESVSDESKRVYDIVLQAQIRAIEAVQPGMTTGELDSVARSFISEKGYGDHFGHSLGHGIGLEVHELPAVRKNGDTVLKPGMVITIEPGIYLPGKGGVRIEDIVVVREKGCDVLTSYTKKLSVLKQGK
jgi:Xaa-Pro aminopeptidase